MRERRENEVEQLRASNAQLRNLLHAMFESTDAIIAIFDGSFECIATNTAFARLYADGADLTGRTLDTIAHTVASSALLDTLEALRQSVHHEQEIRLFSCVRSTHNEQWFEVLAVPLRVQPGSMLRLRDVTQLVESARSSRRSADNQLGLQTSGIERAVRQRLQHGATTVYVSVLDIDQFAVLAEAFGPEVREEVYAHVDQGLNRVAPVGATITRTDDDTFCVVATLPTSGEETDHLVDRLAADLRDAVRQPITLRGRTLRITASVGSALCAEAADAPQALRRADTAMQEAKRRGGNRTVIASATNEVATSHDSTIRLWNAMRTALQFRQMEVWFQPVVDLASSRPVAVEALSRWHHPQFGDVAPAEFIPIAEQNSEILQIGGFVQNRSAEVMRALRASQQIRVGDLHLHLNASANELAWPQYATSLLDRLRVNEVRPEWFSVEISERTLLQPDPAVHHNVRTLAEAGVRVGLDDFGSGATSFELLTQLPIHRIKIDRRFVASMLQNERTERLVAAMITMANDLGLGTVAAGVETAEQAAHLVALGCRSAQGFLFAPAVPDSELVNVLADLIAAAWSRPGSSWSTQS